MLATVIDLLYALYREAVGQRAKTQSQVPKPYRWPRPGQEKPKVVSLRDFARQMIGGR